MTSKVSAKGGTKEDLQLAELIEDIFMVLTEKEKEVIVKRFSLDNKPKLTLERIGQKFSVTRERIRQIEKIALSKLRRTVENTKLNLVNEIANKILGENGEIMREKKLVEAILNWLGSQNEIDNHIIKLALSINKDLEKVEKTNVYYPFWKNKKIRNSDINTILNAGVTILKKKNDVMKAEKLASQVQQSLKDKTFSAKMIASALETDKRVKLIKEGFGLMQWRHINPKSIRDKAYIILKKAEKPLHFEDIAKKITDYGFDKKSVTTQAVHNELIRYDQFVLVGRGLYALKEWGYEKGTVADVIGALLKEKSPMTKQEIIEGVLKQRKVKKGTISLNLQKNTHFVRVGRAVYKYEK
jgi:DNA-directed RNA polymerase delta subunit